MSDQHVTELKRLLTETTAYEIESLRAQNAALRAALAKAEASIAQAKSELTLVQAGMEITKANRLAADIVATTFRLHFDDENRTAVAE